MTYIPQVNDYVKWEKNIEGWVYFKCSQYITIEALVRPKSEENYCHSTIHRNERLLVICYRNQWRELEYIQSRKSINDKN